MNDQKDIKILIIDDETRILKAFSRMLKLADYAVVTTDDSTTGLDLYQQEQPDLVLLDLRMPGKDGLTVLQEIRAHDPEANVILTTGHGDKDAVIAVLRAGAADFLPKPIDQVALESALRRAEERVQLKRKLHASQEALRQQNAQLEALVEVHTAELLQEIEERKQTEQALRESNERFDWAMEASQDGLFDWNLVTHEIYYSPGWKKMLGYAYDELPNDFSVWETLTNAEDVKRSWEMQQELINKKRARFEMEFKMRHKQGHWVDILSRATAIFDKDGNAIRMVGTHVDITASKQMERALQKNESILNVTGSIARIGGWEHNLTTGKATWTRALYDIIEIPHDQEPPGVEAHLYYYPEQDRDIMEKAYNAAVEQGQPFDLELQVYTTNRRLLWCRAQGEPVYENGKCVAMRGTFQDITERKQAEEAVEKLANFPSENPNPVLRISQTGELIYANAASALLLGLWQCQERELLPVYLRELAQSTLVSGRRQSIEVEVKDHIFTLTFAPIPESDYVNVYGLDITACVPGSRHQPG